MSYRPDHLIHSELQTRVCNAFVKCGFYTASMVCNVEHLTEVTNDPTAMVLRTTPDMFVFNKNKAFELDFKTSYGSVLRPEALPLIVHSTSSDIFGTEMLYFCKNSYNEFVFSISSLPQFSVLVIPPDKTYPCKHQMIEWAHKKNIKVYQGPYSGCGSHDPFLKLDDNGCRACMSIDTFFEHLHYSGSLRIVGV